MGFEASWYLGTMLSELLPHFFGRRGRGVSYAAKRIEFLEGIEVFHSIRTMLRKLHKAVAEGDRESY